ncbi:uncharacterized protein LOC135485485 [Lineus longissimus]|uniref:uncharacterized protein LOC135485485 n=1 Tax=Lineus longissimus TaxID=88925 RepID=UPI00315C7CD7
MAGLAIVDTGVLIFSEILWKLIVAHRLVPGMEGSFALLSSLWYGAESMAVSSGLFLAEMSIDRTIAILYPMKAVTICTASRAVKITVSTCLIEVGLHLQTFFVLDVPDPPNGALIRNFPEARWFETFYNTYLLILGTILPFSTIAICNITILVAINRASVRRRKMKSDTAEKGRIRDSNLTAMLLMTSFAYLLCSCPKRIYESSVEYDLSIPYWKARYWLQYFACVLVIFARTEEEACRKVRVDTPEVTRSTLSGNVEMLEHHNLYIRGLLN